MNKKAVLNKIESYLNGEINAEDFSYDFPVTYSFYAKKLDQEDPAFSELMEKKVKVLCRAYDPFDFYNMEGEKVFSEDEFRAGIQSLYEEAKKML
ncbi:MAG: hypothetical protein ACI3W6_03165 [Clostridia bacterium]